MGHYILPDQMQDVQYELNRQEDLKRQGKFKYTCADPEMDDMTRLAVLTEEVGEVARAILNCRGLAKDKGEQDVRKELVQVAAVCIAWLKGLDSQCGRC